MLPTQKAGADTSDGDDHASGYLVIKKSLIF